MAGLIFLLIVVVVVIFVLPIVALAKSAGARQSVDELSKRLQNLEAELQTLRREGVRPAAIGIPPAVKPEPTAPAPAPAPAVETAVPPPLPKEFPVAAKAAAAPGPATIASEPPKPSLPK